jgi:hypothetical protein
MVIALLPRGSAVAAVAVLFYLVLVATIALIAVLTTAAARRRAALTVLKILVRARQPPATVDDLDQPEVPPH